MDARLFLHVAPEEIEQCVGCGNHCFLKDMNPVDSLDWVCKPCFRAELEGLCV